MMKGSPKDKVIKVRSIGEIMRKLERKCKKKEARNNIYNSKSFREPHP